MNIFTDGACKDNARQDGIAEGRGGWAYVILTQEPGHAGALEAFLSTKSDVAMHGSCACRET